MSYLRLRVANTLLEFRRLTGGIARKVCAQSFPNKWSSKHRMPPHTLVCMWDAAHARGTNVFGWYVRSPETETTELRCWCGSGGGPETEPLELARRSTPCYDCCSVSLIDATNHHMNDKTMHTHHNMNNTHMFQSKQSVMITRLRITT